MTAVRPQQLCCLQVLLFIIFNYILFSFLWPFMLSLRPLTVFLCANLLIYTLSDGYRLCYDCWHFSRVTSWAAYHPVGNVLIIFDIVACLYALIYLFIVLIEQCVLQVHSKFCNIKILIYFLHSKVCWHSLQSKSSQLCFIYLYVTFVSYCVAVFGRCPLVLFTKYAAFLLPPTHISHIYTLISVINCLFRRPFREVPLWAFAIRRSCYCFYQFTKLHASHWNVNTCQCQLWKCQIWRLFAWLLLYKMNMQTN